MKKRTNNSGLTLPELLAASIITVFVMIGVASMDISLRNLFSGVSGNASASVNAATIMRHMANRIPEAIGDSTIGGAGIGVATGNGGGNDNRLWIRRDENASHTPEIYTDDAWYSYQYSASAHTLVYCTTPDAPGAPNPSSACNSPVIQTFSNVTEFVPTITNLQASEEFSVSIRLKTVSNASLPYPSATNPEFTLTSAFSIPDTGNTIP
ncbi:MAG: hypothetical protein NT079_02205 [Candidatus Omnitrophica bacterium]|nr:hypothetical protein [Candidatus Omnitrophota bacterium]